MKTSTLISILLSAASLSFFIGCSNAPEKSSPAIDTQVPVEIEEETEELALDALDSEKPQEEQKAPEDAEKVPEPVEKKG